MATADMFLKIEGSKQGPIKGEADDTAHGGEIELLSWNWGMDGNTTAFAQASARAALQELVVRKRVDSSSTAIMSALRNNEVIKRAQLAVRKAGGVNPVEYFKVIIEKARITQYRIANRADENPELVEEIRIGFWKVRVEYSPQDALGGTKGASTFETEVTPT